MWKNKYIIFLKIKVKTKNKDKFVKLLNIL